MTWPRWVLLFSGIAFIAMGVQSYFFPTGDPSIVSLIASGGVGALLVLCTFVSIKNPRLGYIPAVALCLLIVGRFVGTGMSKGFKTYPDMVAIAIGVICAGCLLAGHFLAKKAKAVETEA